MPDALSPTPPARDTTPSPPGDFAWRVLDIVVPDTIPTRELDRYITAAIRTRTNCPRTAPLCLRYGYPVRIDPTHTRWQVTYRTGSTPTSSSTG
ncbi:hypothetical protein [Nocardia thailandica]|uniref:hypothetical protein n=1 Tax=Nocardia thailandica TaxID=257275 RepID=UPI0002E21930|nr:hypothetical protein [Nocardia thailandica]